MKIRLSILLVMLAFCLPVYAQYNFSFGNEVQTFKQQDSIHMPQPGGILFVGSSSIRFWGDLEQRFNAYPVIKRGLGGSKLHQWVSYYMPYMVYPYKPAKIFIYAGENDIADGVPATEVQKSFVAMWRMIRAELPKAQIYFMSIKQSPSRAQYYQEVTKANTLIQKFLKGKAKSYFIDVNTPLLNKGTQQPDSVYFRGDQLHLKPTGYDLWARVLEPYIK